MSGPVPTAVLALAPLATEAAAEHEVPSHLVREVVKRLQQHKAVQQRFIAVVSNLPDRPKPIKAPAEKKPSKVHVLAAACRQSSHVSVEAEDGNRLFCSACSAPVSVSASFVLQLVRSKCACTREGSQFSVPMANPFRIHRTT